MQLTSSVSFESGGCHFSVQAVLDGLEGSLERLGEDGVLALPAGRLGGDVGDGVDADAGPSGGGRLRGERERPARTPRTRTTST